MARIRSIKPEFPHDEKLGECSRDARLLFVLVWTLCDDHGRFRASPIFLRTSLFPYDLDVTPQVAAGWLDELAAKHRVRLYEHNGESYGVVLNWTKHQRIDNAGKPMYPDPPPFSASCGELRRDSAGVDLDLDQDQDHRPCGEPPTDWHGVDLAMVWKIMGEKALAASRTPVANPTAFKRKVAANAKLEHEAEAMRLCAMFEDIDPQRIAAKLMGEDSALRYLKRREAS
jgi:hypothetical protein